MYHWIILCCFVVINFISIPQLTPLACKSSKNEVVTSPTTDNCNKPPNPQSTIDYRFLPNENDPNKVLRVNFVFLHRPANPAKGIAASKEKSTEFQAYIDRMISYMDFQLGNFLYEATPNQCSDIRIDAKIRLDIEKIFITNSYYWNNENDSCPTGCPALRTCDWYATALADSLNAGLAEHEKRINIFFTENETLYDQVQQQAIPKGTKISGDCSMGYRTDLATDARIHMRNEYIKYQNMRWHSKNNNVPMETVMKWAYTGQSRLLLHEIGHTIFGAGHINNKCNIMNGKHNAQQEHLQNQQLQEAHQALSTHNMRKYVNPPTLLSHDYVAKNNELINYDLQLWGNLIVPKNTTLTVSCHLRMPPNSQIILQEGAKLIIDGGNIQPAFKNTTWQGIEKEASNMFVNLFRGKNTNKAVVQTINGGTIVLK